MLVSVARESNLLLLALASGAVDLLCWSQQRKIQQKREKREKAAAAKGKQEKKTDAQQLAVAKKEVCADVAIIMLRLARTPAYFFCCVVTACLHYCYRKLHRMRQPKNCKEP